jgi:hypothetical protein
MRKIFSWIVLALVCLILGWIAANQNQRWRNNGILVKEESSCTQGAIVNDNLRIKTAGPAAKDAGIALNLANEFVQRQQNLKRFLITDPAVSGTNGIYEVRYKLLTKSEEGEAVVAVDVGKKTCGRIK